MLHATVMPQTLQPLQMGEACDGHDSQRTGIIYFSCPTDTSAGLGHPVFREETSTCQCVLSLSPLPPPPHPSPPFFPYTHIYTPTSSRSACYPAGLGFHMA